MSGKQLIAETPHVSAIAQDCGGDTVFVTFNAMGVLRNGLDFWADRFFLKRGISAIGVMTARPNWFPAADMAEILPQIRNVIGARRVVTYGHSQGAYGALRYARQLDAAVTLAFCPQWSIDPQDVASFDPRYAAFFDRALQNGSRIEQQHIGQASFVFFDSREYPDAQHAKRLAALHGVSTIAAPFTMHDTIRLITEGGGSHALIDACLHGAPPIEQLRRIVRQSRARSPTYHKYVLSHLLQRSYSSGKRSSVFFSRSLERHTELSPFHAVLTARAAHDDQAAEQALEGVQANHFDGVDLIFLWTLCHRLQFLQMERKIANEILARRADKTFDCLHAINTLIRAQEMKRAQTELERIVRHHDALSYVGTLVELAVKLRRTDIAEGLLEQPMAVAMEVPLRFRLVELYHRLQQRPKAFRTLMKLQEVCAERADHMTLIAAYLLAIGEVRFALELREKLLRRAPDDIDRNLDTIEARIGVDARRATQELQQLTRSVQLTAQQWDRVSVFYERLGALRKALAATRAALDHSDALLSFRVRQVYLLILINKRRRARRELTAALSHPRADAGSLRFLGELALRINDFSLAVRCAERQFTRDPHNTDAVIYYARCRRMADEQQAAREQLSALFAREQRFPSMADYQWIALMQELLAAGLTGLAKQAALEVSARDPNEPTAQQILGKIELLERHGGGVAVSQHRVVPVMARTRLARWFSTYALQRNR